MTSKAIDFFAKNVAVFWQKTLTSRSTSLDFWTERKTVLEVKNHFEVAVCEAGQSWAPKRRHSRTVSLIDIPYLNRFEASLFLIK